ncbi:MAG: right-handed parallel beta-helix repeat-containing protein [Halodesulfurarchaeum sp.]
MTSEDELSALKGDEWGGPPWTEDGAVLVEALVREDPRPLDKRTIRNRSLQKLIDQTPDGGTVTIPPGTYEHGFVVDDRKNLTVTAEPGTVWIVEDDLDATVVDITNSHHVTIEGLGLLHDPVGSCLGDALGIRRSHDITIINNDLSGSGVAGVRASDSANLSIHDNHIHNSTAHPVFLRDVANVEVVGNLVRNNHESRDWRRFQGVNLHSVYGDIVVAQNVFVDNPSGPITVWQHDKANANDVLPTHTITIAQNAFAQNQHPKRPTIDFEMRGEGRTAAPSDSRLTIIDNCFDTDQGRTDVDAHVGWASQLDGNIVDEVVVDEDYAVSAPASCVTRVDAPSKWVELYDAAERGE